MNVQVVFSRNHSPGSLLLRTFLWSPWSHCALVDGDMVIEAAAFHGVRERPLSEFFADASKREVIEIKANASAVLAAARSQIGKPYDWTGAAGIGMRRNWQDDDAWFCSELVAWAFEAGGRSLFRSQPWRITPRDIYIPLLST